MSRIFETDRALRRRPPCRDSGGDARSQELAARMVEHGRAISSLQRELLADVSEFDRTEAWRGDGATSMGAWLTERLGISHSAARVWVKVAVQLESLPHLADALADGTLSLDILVPIAEVATPGTDAELAASSAHLTVKQARELAESHRGATDAAAARQFEHRSLRLNDAACTIWAALTKDDYAVAKAALIGRVSAGSESGLGGDPLGYVSFDQRLCDAFVDLCRVDRATKSNGGFRPTMVVHADLGLLTGSSGGGFAEIQGVGPISREVARRLACDAKIMFSVERRDGSILDQKRVRRSPTMAQRIEIARRDKGCRFPSCNYVDFTQVHHVVPWILGGETNQSNLITLCGRHHRAVHELGWLMKGSAEEVISFTNPHGHTMTSAPSPTWRWAGSKQRATPKQRAAPMRR